jgi:DNA-binding transcriptional ArsR family regulator
MSSTNATRSSDPVLECLADRRRRRVLEILLERTGPVGERELARLLGADENRTTDCVPAEEVRDRRVDLVHARLPALEEAGLVDWDREDGTVATSGHPLDDPPVHRLLDRRGDGVGEVVASLASERRRVLLRVLRARGEPMTMADLAGLVAARVPDQDADADTVERMRASLHHRDLPALDDAGLVEVDPHDGTVSYVGHPLLTGDWLDCSPVALESIRPAAD